MLTPECKTWKLGRFTVRQGVRPDNPAFAVYMVFVGEKLIGRSFSVPDRGCCEWLQRQHAADRPVYATQSAQPKKGILRGVAKIPKPRVLLLEIPEPA